MNDTVIDKLLKMGVDCKEVYEHKEVREVLYKSTFDWLYDLADWSNFVTLTFREYRYPDVALSLWHKLVKILNVNALGKHYNRVVGESYFSYVLGIEYTKNDIIHFHVITDSSLNYKLVHKTWQELAGFVWIDQIKNKTNVLKYVTKYFLKAKNGGDLLVYIAKNNMIKNKVRHWN